MSRPIEAVIARYCVLCAGSKKAVKDCEAYDCPLRPFRMGREEKRGASDASDGRKKHDRPKMESVLFIILSICGLVTATPANGKVTGAPPTGHGEGDAG